MLGVTFKENCPDVRNTKIVDVVAALKDCGIKVTIFDPWANPKEVMHEYGFSCHPELAEGPKFDGIILTVAHKEFLDLDLKQFLKENGVVYDVKGILKNSDNRL